MGYRALCVDGTPKSRLICIHCKDLLRNPVQTEEGFRLCASCFDAIRRLPEQKCGECGVTLTSELYYPDRAVEREVLALLVCCQYKSLGCLWEGQLQNWEGHMAACTYKGTTCPHSGCGQLVAQSDLEEHAQGCPHRLVKCDYCQLQVPLNKKQDHESVCNQSLSSYSASDSHDRFPGSQLCKTPRDGCEMMQCLTCEVKKRDDTMQEFLEVKDRLVAPSLLPVSESLGSPTAKSKFQAFSSSSDTAQPPTRSLQCDQLMQHYAGSGPEEREAVLKFMMLVTENFSLRAELDSVKADVSGIKSALNSIMNLQVHEGGRGNEGLRAEVERLVARDQTTQKHLQSLKMDVMDVEEVKREMISMKRDRGQDLHEEDGGVVDVEHPRGGHDSSTLQQLRLLEELQRQASMKVQLSELELQLQASLASTYNGSFIWRIPDITRRRRDAIDGRLTSIYSPPFYTDGRNGYKMCIRGYLNGDGMGYQSHLSLFFVIMLGENDVLLKWPFKYKVSMILVDQTHSKHIVWTFKPTPESQSFQRPTTEMNVASGCPQFAKLSVFADPCYVKDDVMFIKCIVDTITVTAVAVHR